MEIEPLRRLGYSLEAATLQQVAYNHGIEMNIQNMSQAQKAQLRYIAIMEQSTNAMGDMARTIDSPANQLRILESRIQTLKRAIGDSLMPVISAVLPYITAFVQILGEAFRSIAEFMGFELPVFDYSDIKKSGEEIANGFEDATKASKEFKGTLASIDQLNIIGSDKEKGAGTGNLFGVDLGLTLPEYDFLGNLKENTSEAYNALKSFINEALPWLEAFAAALSAAFITNKIGNFITGLSNLKTAISNVFGANASKFTKTISGIAGGLAAGASSGILFYNSIKNLITGTGKLGNNIAQLGAGLGIAVGAITLFMKAGNPLGAVLTAIGATVGVVAGVWKGLEENTKAAAKAIMDSELYNNGGTKIDKIAEAFGNLAEKATLANQEIISKYDDVHRYDSEMSNLVNTMKDIAGVDLKLSEISPADAAALKEPFNELCTYLKTTFEEEVKTVAGDVAQIFSDLNLSGTIGAELQVAYKELQTLMDDTLTESQKNVSNYLDQMASGQKLTDEEMAKFKNEFGYVTELSLKGDTSISELEAAFDELSLDKIDAMSEEEGVAALNDMADKFNAYALSVQDRYNAEAASVKKLQDELDTAFKYNKIDLETYNAKTDLLNMSLEIFGENATTQLKQMAEKAQSVTETIIDQAIGAAEGVEPTGAQRWATAWSSVVPWQGYMNVNDYAVAQALMNNQLYNTAQDVNTLVATAPYRLDIETNITYLNEDTAETMAIIKNQMRPELDLLIGRMEDETGEWKYIVGTEQSLISMGISEIKDQTGSWDYITGEKTASISVELTSEPVNAAVAGSMLGLGAIKGIEESIPGLNDAVEKMGLGALNTLRSTWDEHSPSKKSEDISDYFMQGLGIGITENQNAIFSALDYVAVQSIMRLAKIKDSMGDLNFGEINTDKITSDFSFQAPSIGSVKLQQQQGAAREAYSNAAQAASNSNGDSVADININLQSYVELDGEQVGYAVSQFQQRQMMYSNGR